jgi:hypothetical protein
VTIKRITLYAYDSSGQSGEDVCVELYRSSPSNGGADLMGSVCSSGASNANPQILTGTDLTCRRITGGHGPSLRVHVPAPLTTLLHAVRITYSYEADA